MKKQNLTESYKAGVMRYFPELINEEDPAMQAPGTPVQSQNQQQQDMADSSPQADNTNTQGVAQDETSKEGDVEKISTEIIDLLKEGGDVTDVYLYKVLEADYEKASVDKALKKLEEEGKIGSRKTFYLSVEDYDATEAGVTGDSVEDDVTSDEVEDFSDDGNGQQQASQSAGDAFGGQAPEAEGGAAPRMAMKSDDEEDDDDDWDEDFNLDDEEDDEEPVDDEEEPEEEDDDDAEEALDDIEDIETLIRSIKPKLKRVLGNKMPNRAKSYKRNNRMMSPYYDDYYGVKRR